MEENEPKGLNHELGKGLSFLGSLSAFLVKLDAGVFALGVFCKISVQSLAFISMLLPIKIVLFLSPAQDMPNILADYFNSKNQFIVVLSVLVLVFMSLSYFFSKVVIYVARRKVEKIIELRARTLRMQRIKKLRNIVDLCISLYSAFILGSVYTIGVFIVYDDIFYLMIAILLTFFSVNTIGALLNIKTILKLQYMPDKVFQAMTNAIFIAAFFFMVFDVVVNEAKPNFLALVIGLVLVRQAANMINEFLSKTMRLHLTKKPILRLLEPET